MQLCLIIVPIILLCSCTLAELQGPDAETRSSQDVATATIDNKKEDISHSESKKDDDNKEEEQIKPEISNERKSAKYIAGAPQTATDVDAFGSKSLRETMLAYLLRDKLLRQRLNRDIERLEEIHSKEKTNEPVDPTPEQIEAHTIYEKAVEMLLKPRANRQVAYSLLEQAAAMNHANARAKVAWAHLFGHWWDFNYAASEFEDLANEGLPEANMGLAFLYSMGIGGKNVSQPMALIHLTLAALGDNSYAQMALGYRYLFGINVPSSCEKALSFYKKVAKKVASKVTFSNGPMVHRVRLLDESENPGSHETEIVDYYQLLADKGDVQSQVGLGQLYYQGGKAIQQDHQKALEYFTQAANAGNAISFAFLGKLYLEGSEYIKADNETAFKYFKKAADLGDPVGQSGLGLMYLNGLGVPKDTVEALTYFTQAADQGWVDGQLQLGNMYFTGNGVKTDYKLAIKYFNLASQSGHVLAYYNLGIMHAYGMGMLRSCQAAVEFFKNVSERGRWSTNLMQAYSDYKSSRTKEAFMQYALLAELGYEVAQGNAAFLLDKGDVQVFHNRHEELIRAFYYWKRAASQGYSAAQVKLGDYYFYGWGTNVDFETAAALYRKASEQQYNAQAMFNLGYMHEQGLGMKKDWHLAKRWYDVAAETNADAKVPVAMALLKLQVRAKLETIKDSPYKFIFYLDENITANWDLYMITILTLLLGLIMYTRRPYQQQQQQQQQQQPQQQQQDNAADALGVNPQPDAATNAPANDTRTVNEGERDELHSESPNKPVSSSVTPPLLSESVPASSADSHPSTSSATAATLSPTSTPAATSVPANSSIADPTE